MRTILLILIACCFSLTAFTQVSSPGLSLLGQLPYDTATLAGCWHHVDAQGREYALVGTSKGLSIVDLSNPAQPFQRFHIPMLPNNWREVKTWNGFAYVGSEAVNSGITIVDLRQLPDTVSYKVWYGDGAYEGQVIKSHTVATADGYLYIFGGATLTDGAIICSLQDPWNPKIVGTYTTNYIHDGYIRNDTLWAGEIYQGQFSVIDVSDKSNPVLLATHPTPGGFNHNTWLSDDGQTLYTTDEKLNAPLAAFNISDLDNISLLDVYYPSQNPTREVHNVRVLDNFLINPSYGGQLTIVDAHRPDNLIETSWAILGNSLVWDADPYLPSGIVIATAKNEGLFIFQPEYKRAAYLEGMITDAGNGLPINGVKVFIENTVNADTSNINGEYKTGVAASGSYAVRVEKTGYQTQLIPNVSLVSGLVTELNIELTPALVTAKGADELVPLRVSPTLFNDHITVETPVNYKVATSGATASILNLNGQVVHQARLIGPRTELQISEHLPAGQYFVVLRKQGQISMPVRVVKG